MNTSFYNGISGIKSHQYGIDVLADNISNINTVGYKSTQAEFSTIFSTTLTDSYFDSTLNDKGLGSRVNATSTNMSQGIFQNSDNKFDLAIAGDGWFGIQDQNKQIFYTRDGNFGVDSAGDLVDSNGNYLLGTSGANITPVTLSQDKMQNFGLYYTSNGNSIGEAYAISDIDDIILSNVDSQTKINLPDILYYPPVATTNVSFKANLDPAIKTDATQIDINPTDINQSIDSINHTITINGTVSNTPEILNPKSGDVVLLTITDINGNSIRKNVELDNNLNWSISNLDISSLDTNSISVNAKLQTLQEIPNMEHFSSTVISPSGNKDILDMTYTKRIPQGTNGTTWDGDIKILSFYEDYIIEQYDPNKTYDSNVYNIDNGMVTKKYDPTQYVVDTNTRKVYQIIDSKTAVLNFGGDGELLQSQIPTISNGGVPLNLDLGEPNSFTGFVSSINLDKARVESHDGYIEGYLKDYGMDSRGNIIAEFNNGRSVPVAKIAVYHFQNDQGLERVDNTKFKYSSNSGKPIFFTDENGINILGTNIYSGKLESSNVNLANALTELIVMQKAYDANAKSITTSDQMIQKAINMKR